MYNRIPFLQVRQKSLYLWYYLPYMSNYAFFDVHSHVHDKAFNEDREDLLSRMSSVPMGAITVGTDLAESREALALATKHDHIFATVGLHPADNVLEVFQYEEYKKMAQHPKVLAIGECGLDYFYVEQFFEGEKESKGITWSKEEEKVRQHNIFVQQITLAHEVGKPLMLHIRDVKGKYEAYEDAIALLQKAHAEGEKVLGNVHFFAGNIDVAQAFLDLGFTVSFPGTITFTKEYDDVVRFVPLEMMHAETDSPYAAPVPYRGKRNEPPFVQEIVAKISLLKEQDMEEVRVQLVENAKRVFKVS